MKTIGFDTTNFLVYEGNTFLGHPLWPSPSLLPATIVDEHNDDLTPVENSRYDYPPFLFLDDGYDPTSRIRKGRIYEKYQGVQPYPWNVYPHPATDDDLKAVNNSGVVNKQLATFCEFKFRPKLKQLEINNPLIILGTDTQFTIWSVIDVETSISGETILFLKARKTIGVLPRVDYSEIDEKHHEQIKNKLNLLADDVYKAGPDSIVDRSREAASAIINAYLLEQGHIEKHKDLGQLVKPLREKAEKHIVANCADTLAKLHSRTKYVEQENKSLRHVSESDAEYALHSVATILNEFGWVK